MAKKRLNKEGLIVANKGNVARDIRRESGTIKNTDGSQSTHLMSFGTGESKKRPYEVNPTVFPNKDKTWTKLTDKPMEAYREAQKRKEVFGFKSGKKAEKFSYGIGYKQGDNKKEAKGNYKTDKKEGRLYTQTKEFKETNKVLKKEVGINKLLNKVKSTVSKVVKKPTAKKKS